MHCSDTIRPKKVRRRKAEQLRTTEVSTGETAPCVTESVPGGPGNPKIEPILPEIPVNLNVVKKN